MRNRLYFETPTASTSVHFLHSKEFCAILLITPCKILSSSARIFALSFSLSVGWLSIVYLLKIKVQAPLSVLTSTSIRFWHSYCTVKLSPNFKPTAIVLFLLSKALIVFSILLMSWVVSASLAWMDWIDFSSDLIKLSVTSLACLGMDSFK